MPHSCDLGSLDRRDFLVLLAAGVVAAVGGCRRAPTGPVAGADPLIPKPGGPLSATTTLVPPPLPQIPLAQPGRAVVVSHAPDDTQQIAFTIDDGFCGECVAGYVDFAERTGFNLTFSPNGAFHDIWDTYAARLQPLIMRGQVQIGNHTWSHPNLLTLGDSAIRKEIERNEDWIQATFGITARPWFRPPYGKHNSHTDGVAASLGYTKILMWNGTLGDAVLETEEGLLSQADKWIKAGAIVLGHANHPTIIHVFDQLQAIVADRGLEPVTLDMMFGTTRADG